ncbi:unnamed protein product, partial [Gulo gulo]
MNDYMSAFMELPTWTLITGSYSNLNPQCSAPDPRRKSFISVRGKNTSISHRVFSPCSLTLTYYFMETCVLSL